MNRTIKELAEKSGRIYVYLANDELGNKFLQQAETEGFTFCDGIKPTERNYAEIMAVNHDFTINFVGANGRIAFGAGADRIGGETLIKVDFEKYIAGDENFLLPIRSNGNGE